MSTVVLTPTHIASDHGVVMTTYPSTTYVDLNHKKIFISPDRKFLVGVCGEYRYEDVDTDAFFDITRDLLTEVITQYADDDSDSAYLFKDDDKVTAYRKLVDNQTFVITKTMRLLFHYSKTRKKMMSKTCGDYAGLGSGGNFAAGLLIGGFDIESIWEAVHQSDPMSSVAHTIVDLSTLQDWE